jgi:hypothetical protein
VRVRVTTRRTSKTAFEGTEPGSYTEVLLIQTAHGLRKVAASARIAAVLPKMKIGARYRLTYRGTVAIKGGQNVKAITVERVLDGAPEAEFLREPGDEADAVPF